MPDFIYKNAIRLMRDRNAGEALRYLHGYVKENTRHAAEYGIPEQLEEIQADYDRMRDFMLDGFQDADRDKVNDRICHRLVRLFSLLRLAESKQHKSVYRDAAARTAAFTLDPSAVRQQLETFVTDLALAGLEDDAADSARKPTVAQIHQRYHYYVSVLFDAVLVSPIWDKGMEEGMTSLILSPTVEPVASLPVVSAVMLSAMNIFDPRKWMTLVSVYEKADDERLRQRALIGWLLALTDEACDFWPEVRSALSRLLADATVRREVLECQMQIFYCMDADQDKETIMREIIPNLMKGQTFRLDENGEFVEKEDDVTEDILDPDAADRKMEQMEASMRRMMNMQKAGSDIYFGGFSHMKRMSFFIPIINWFVPFYPEHPDIAGIREKTADLQLFEKLAQDAPFCDSDKYSFVLAIGNVIDKMPPAMREMMGASVSFNPGEIGSEELQSATFVRRQYLQDLYRFFRLYSSQAQFEQAFRYSGDTRLSKDRFFMVYDHVGETVGWGDTSRQLLRFLLKRKDYEHAARVAEAYRDETSPAYLLQAGHTALGSGKTVGGLSATEWFEKALRLSPDSLKAREGYARAAYAEGDYSAAADAYDALLAQDPDNENYQLLGAMSFVRSDRLEKAQPLLARLDYLHPEHLHVRRAMAWYSLYQKDFPKAEEIFREISQASEADAYDRFHLGYGLWLGGKGREAVGAFLSSGIPAEDVFSKDFPFLSAFGVTRVDVQLMLDSMKERRS